MEESLSGIIKRYKNRGSGASQLLSQIKKSTLLQHELKMQTSFLDDAYEKVGITQRIYHLIFDEYELRKCVCCPNPSRFGRYNRFSFERDKKDSNYENTCWNAECFAKDFINRCVGDQSIGSLISLFAKWEELGMDLAEKTRFIEDTYENVTIQQRLYHIHFGNSNIKYCECGDPLKWGEMNSFSRDDIKSDSNYNRTCGKKECLSIIIKDSYKKTLFEKYGVLNVNEIPLFTQKISSSLYDRYNTANMWEVPGYREKIEQTNLNRYGHKYFTSTQDFKQKTKKKIEENWGGAHPTTFQSVIDKRRETNLEKYGYICALQNPEVRIKANKSCYRRKPYKLPSGEIVNLQGYEGYALDLILKNYDESDILIGEKMISEIGDICYNMNETERFYYPDFYIRSKNLVIEVKSPYTYDNMLQENLLKRDSVLMRGMNFQFWIMDKAILLEIID
jgi:very-short-patch-repair endonuclease